MAVEAQSGASRDELYRKVNVVFLMRRMSANPHKFIFNQWSDFSLISTVMAERTF